MILLFQSKRGNVQDPSTVHITFKVAGIILCLLNPPGRERKVVIHIVSATNHWLDHHADRQSSEEVKKC